jgi:hypothetical protein
MRLSSFNRSLAFRGTILVSGVLALLAARVRPVVAAVSADYVIAISVDGLGSSYLKTLLKRHEVPNFQRFRSEGAWTDNARNDYNVTVTLPNHTTMLTGRGVQGSEGHHWTLNVDPPKGMTLHSNRGFYVASAFDVAHDHGLRTCLYTGKTKFSLYATSYDAEHGAPDKGPADHGRNKIDTFDCRRKSVDMTRDYVAAMKEKPFQYSFIHFADPDAAGHPHGWGSDAYYKAIRNVDACLGTLFDFVESDPALRGHTIMILTADHGGMGHNHVKFDEPLVYTIPFYTWGVHVARGKDLYSLNKDTRLDPGPGRPAYSAAEQPIRNGDMANLALKLLGLGPAPGSTINPRQDLQLDDATTAVQPAKAAAIAPARDQKPLATAG